MTPETYISRNAKIPWRIIEQEAVLVEVEKGEVMHLNEVGASIWDFLGCKRNIGEIIQHVCDSFEIDSKTAQDDVMGFVQELIDKRLVVTQDE